VYSKSVHLGNGRPLVALRCLLLMLVSTPFHFVGLSNSVHFAAVLVSLQLEVYKHQDLFCDKLLFYKICRLKCSVSEESASDEQLTEPREKPMFVDVPSIFAVDGKGTATYMPSSEEDCSLKVRL